MKEIRLSFEISVALKRTDVHWVEEELLKDTGGVIFRGI
jgi:hypothetical protein